MTQTIGEGVKKPFIDKYRPKNTKEIQGHPTAIQTLKTFLETYKKQHKKAVLLYGPPGCGKTSLVYALAQELDYDIVEVNASDYRNTEAIERIIGNASKQMSLFMRPKIILIDEVDGLSGTKDRGGIPTLTKIIQKTQFPIIMTANDPWNKKFAALRKVVQMLELSALKYTSIVKILKKICTQENITYKEEDLKSLARRAGGDVRGAINDLQTFSITGDMSVLELDEKFEREKREKITNALTKIFKSKEESVYVGAFNDVEEDMDEIFLWIDENVPREYKQIKDIQRAYEKLTKADIFRKRIRKWQYYRYMVYVYMLLSAGIALAKKEKYQGFVKYEPTKRKLDIWRYNIKNEQKKNIAKKIASITHCSSKTAMEDAVPFLKIIFRKTTPYAKKIQQKFTQEFELEEAEIKWLKSL